MHGFRPVVAQRTSSISCAGFPTQISLLRRRFVRALSSFEYAVLRIVPRVEREEFINAGVIVFCLERKFLRARVHVDEERLRALYPDLDIEHIRDHLEGFRKVAEG